MHALLNIFLVDVDVRVVRADVLPLGVWSWATQLCQCGITSAVALPFMLTCGPQFMRSSIVMRTSSISQASQLVAPLVKGIQSNNISACIK